MINKGTRFIAIASAAFAISQSGVAWGGSDLAYKNVFTLAGIVCNGYHVKSLRPVLADDGYFSCQCTTDTDCLINNPHRRDYSGEIDLEIAAGAPKGTSCRNPVPWFEAQHNIGRTLVVTGPVVDVKTTTNVRRSPTWINVGMKFPHANRLNLVIWNDTQSSIKPQQPKQLEGKSICAIGKIANYRGTPQIVLRTAADFRILSQ